MDDSTGAAWLVAAAPPRARVACGVTVWCLTAVLSLAAAGQNRPRPDRALYVWDLATRLDRPRTLLDIAKKIDVGRFFLATSRTVMTRREALGRLLKRASALGIESYAVLAENSWALAPRHGAGLARVDDLLALNRTWTRAGRFKGVHLDVEVHALDEFKALKRTQREKRDEQSQAGLERLLIQWLDWIAAVRDRVRAERPALKTSVAVPHWFLKRGSPYQVRWRGRGREVIGHLLETVDEVVVMAYTNRPHAITRLASEELELATRPGRARIRVAVSVSPHAPAETTLFGGGLDALVTALRHIEKTYADRPEFAGTAVHMFEGVRRLVDEGEDK
jgi:hypothetical protein